MGGYFELSVIILCLQLVLVKKTIHCHLSLNYPLQVEHIDMKIEGNDGNSIKLVALQLEKMANLHQNLPFFVRYSGDSANSK